MKSGATATANKPKKPKKKKKQQQQESVEPQPQRQQQQQQESSSSSVSLAKDSLVEVTSDEEGFRGAWYLATLLRPPPPPPRSASSSNDNDKDKKKRKSKISRNDKAYVQYHTLVAEEGSSVLLREYVNAEFLRPLPPHYDSSSFHLGDVVDAYYRDGWWTGVVTAILLLHHKDHNNDDVDPNPHPHLHPHPPLLRFVVTFQNPPDELHFSPSELRFHLQWVDYKWLRPPNQRAAGLMFSVGKRVEVSFDRDEWRDTWFPATILKDIGNDSFVVEYHSVDAAPLKATVDSLHIRPCPPHLKDNNFGLLEKVDAHYDFGWWSGVITKALADCRYIVFFKQTNKEGEFNHMDLRPHMEWKDGKWFASSQDILNMLEYQKHEGHGYNNVNNIDVGVPVGSSGLTESNFEEKATSSLNLVENPVELSTPCSEEPPRVNSLPQEKTQETPICGDKDMLKEEIPAVMTSPIASQPNMDTTGTMGKIKSFDLASPSSESIDKNVAKKPLGADHSSENHTWGKRVKRKRVKTTEDDDKPTSGSGRSSSSSRKLQVKSPTNSVGSREGNAGVNAAEGVHEECTAAETNLPVVLGLECDKSSNSSTRKPCLSSGEELSNLPHNHVGLDDNEPLSIKDGNQLDSEEKIPKRRRGRPRKVVISRSISSASEEPRKEVIVDELLVKDCIIDESDSLQDVEVKSAIMDSSVTGQEYVINGSGKNIIRNQEKQKSKTGSSAILSALRKLSEEVVEASTKHQERHSSKRVRRRTINLNSVSQVQDSPHASVSKADESSCMTKELEKVIEELPTNTFEDQPLSKWFQEMHSPTTNDAPRLSPPRSLEQCAVASNGQLETLKENHAVDKCKIVGSELQNLPFVKNTLLWSTLESMEVFQKLPQKPHFRPLEQCKESSREGLAIGCMVTFSSVVERTSRLQFDDPKSTIDDILETLVELESHGFDVQIVRDRITDLITMKNKQEKLQEQVEQLHSEIDKHKLEKAKLDEEEDKINKQMKYLQEKLSQVASTKETKDREIASVQSKLEEIKNGIKSMQSDFESLATLV